MLCKTRPMTKNTTYCRSTASINQPKFYNIFFQISLVPSAGFWDGMSCLKILLLHDNPIGKLENLHHLSACECLTVLTLYDTPLSLKRNYRHHVVNSIWTLQALDSMVISDEEIIEDAVFGGEFSAMHPAFHINLCPMLSEVIINLNGLLLFYIHLDWNW